MESNVIEASSADLRCENPECDLYRLKLEPDEVAPTPGATPDQCAECGHELSPYRGE